MSSKEYVADRVRAALAGARGDATAAQRALIAECARDGRLLRGLVAPYLQGIVAHAVGRPGRSPKPAKSAELSPNVLDTILGQLGEEIGEASQPRGMTALTETPSRPEAGPGHQAAIRQLAASYKRKRRDV